MQFDQAITEIVKRIRKYVDGRIAAVEKMIQPMPDVSAFVTADYLETMMKEQPAPKDGRDGVDGKDGRDALQLEILPSIDPEKSYSRGTYALHKGGLWRSFESTHGMRGWECIVNGIADIQISLGDNLRELTVTVEKSCGKAVEKMCRIPVMIYRDVYKSGESYEQGDCVTWGGAVWVCLKDTDQKPGSASGEWKLAVKAGRNANTPAKKAGE